MKVSKKDMLKWIEALRSGEYAQTTGRLQDFEGYCCLGVACELFAPSHDRDHRGILIGNVPITLNRAPKWLEMFVTDFYNKTKVDLAGLNDGVELFHELSKSDQQFSFDEIADLLQAVYIEKALE